MRTSLVVMLTAMLGLPQLSFAGWGDLLDNVEKVDKLITNRPAPAPAPEPAEPSEEAPPRQRQESRPSAPHTGSDAHFIQPDDYFISDHDLGRQAWMWVTLSKVVTPPTPATKEEGEFMTVRDGQNKWTSHYWRTRIATEGELRLGMHVIAFNDNHRGDVYQAPAKKDSARGGGWFYAKITDMSDMYKGFVTVSGNYKVGLKNLRAIIR